MKCLCALLILLVSCNTETVYIGNYSISYHQIVPDSLKDKQAQFVTETVRAASNHMTGGDYEDPEDVIREANNTFVEIYGVQTIGLYNSDNMDWLPYYNLSNKQKAILDELQNR